jgi:hypothetical protein
LKPVAVLANKKASQDCKYRDPPIGPVAPTVFAGRQAFERFLHLPIPFAEVVCHQAGIGAQARNFGEKFVGWMCLTAFYHLLLSLAGCPSPRIHSPGRDCTITVCAIWTSLLPVVEDLSPCHRDRRLSKGNFAAAFFNAF